MPEAVVSVQAAIGDHGDIALGNVIGSNIANLGLILGLMTLVRPPKVNGELRRRELPVLVATAIAVPLLLLDGRVQPYESAALLAALVVGCSAAMPALDADEHVSGHSSITR